MTEDVTAESAKWLYRGVNLDTVTVVRRLAVISPLELTEVHGNFIGLYLREGPEAYRRKRDTYAHYKEYRLIKVLMAKLLMGLKAIRGDQDEANNRRDA